MDKYKSTLALRRTTTLSLIRVSRYVLIFSFLALLLVGFLPSTFAATTIVVNEGNMHGWAFVLTDSSGVPYHTGGDFSSATGTAQFTTGPGTPPDGTGSASLATGDGTTGGDGSAAIGTANFDGIRLDALTTLSYYAYSSVNNGQQFPYLTLSISTGLSSPASDILFLEPPYQTPTSGNPSCPNQGATVMNTWQKWDALNGCYWDFNNLAGPGTGVEPLSFFLKAYPNAVIQSFTDFQGLGFPTQGIALNVGFGSPTDKFSGAVDAFLFGSGTTQVLYDFEHVSNVTGVPQFPLGLIALIGISVPALVLLKARYTSKRPAS